MNQISLTRRHKGSIIIALFFSLLGFGGLAGSLEWGYSLRFIGIPLPREVLLVISILLLLLSFYVMYSDLTQFSVKPFAIQLSNEGIRLPHIVRPYGWRITNIPWSAIREVTIIEESYGNNIGIFMKQKNEPIIIYCDNFLENQSFKEAHRIIAAWHKCGMQD